MKPESLHQAIHAEPFRPFQLILADGTRLPVPHPEWILHPSKARTVILMNEDEGFRVLDVGLLLGVEVGPPVPAGSVSPNPNGGE